jgi:hypothetical protein
VHAETIEDCGRDLEYLLQETDVVESKASLRSFIKRIEMARENAKVHYILPIPPDGKMRESPGALPMATSNGEGGGQTRTPFQHMIPSHQNSRDTIAIRPATNCRQCPQNTDEKPGTSGNKFKKVA